MGRGQPAGALGVVAGRQSWVRIAQLQSRVPNRFLVSGWSCSAVHGRAPGCALRSVADRVPPGTGGITRTVEPETQRTAGRSASEATAAPKVGVDPLPGLGDDEVKEAAATVADTRRLGGEWSQRSRISRPAGSRPDRSRSPTDAATSPPSTGQRWVLIARTHRFKLSFKRFRGSSNVSRPARLKVAAGTLSAPTLRAQERAGFRLRQNEHARVQSPGRRLRGAPSPQHRGTAGGLARRLIKGARSAESQRRQGTIMPGCARSPTWRSPRSFRPPPGTLKLQV